MFEIYGYLSAVLIGLSLGLIGGGGSILTVPVLVYLFGISPVYATAYSLFIVGLTSLIGTYSYFNKQLISIKTALIFGAPSILAVYLTRKLAIPAIPEVIFTHQNFVLSKNILLMVIFAVLMIAASYSMLKKQGPIEEENLNQQNFNYPLILLEGTLVGGLTGLVGAGGGFLIIPALVILSKLPMKMAIGTSLLIIAVKSLIGFLGDVANLTIDWSFLLGFTLISISGNFVGTFLSSKISGQQLKPIFGWFVLVMGMYILGKELFF